MSTPSLRQKNGISQNNSTILFVRQGLVHSLFDLGDGLVDRQELHDAGLAILQLHLSLSQTFAADDNPQRNADQVIILELDARALVAVIEEDFDSKLLQPCVDVLGPGQNRGILAGI